MLKKLIWLYLSLLAPVQAAAADPRDVVAFMFVGVEDGITTFFKNKVKQLSPGMYALSDGFLKVDKLADCDYQLTRIKAAAGKEETSFYSLDFSGAKPALEPFAENDGSVSIIFHGVRQCENGHNTQCISDAVANPSADTLIARRLAAFAYFQENICGGTPY